MSRRILDTSRLIQFWRQTTGGAVGGKSPEDARRWAHELIAIRGTKAVVTPVLVEFVAGTTSSQELELAKAYLSEFECIDKGRILDDDWKNARRRAERVPRNRRKRHLGDCLIAAIAERLNHEVDTDDRAWPRS